MKKATSTLILFRLLLVLLFSSPSLWAASATIQQFTGADPGEGLDLEGTFIYAIGIGPETEDPGQAGDAYFTTDQIPGVEVVAVNSILSWHTMSETFAETDADKTIATVLKSIRWSPNPSKPQITLSGLVKGAKYKLQLLFAEDCCAGRGFDVYVDGVLIADEFQAATYQVKNDHVLASAGAVISYEFIGTKDTVTVVLDGTTATSNSITDRNPIINGLTLEQEESPGDSDNDGLPDSWETLYFGNLSQSGSDDFDHDGLTNAEELLSGTHPGKEDSDGDGLKDGQELKTLGTDPNRVDTDADGLSDGDEVNKSGTDPKLADTDGDGLTDGDEVNLSHTDPKKPDTDGDGASDFVEFFSGTDPLDPFGFPRSTVVNRFFGGDAGEGLDLDGNIIYAFAVSPNTTSPGQVRDAFFGPDSGDGILVTAGNNIGNWLVPNYRDTDNDNALEVAVTSIRWANAASPKPAIYVDLDNLEVGKRYKLQLLFSEQCCPGRGFDVFLRPAADTDGLFPRFDSTVDQMLAHDFGPALVQGGAGNTKAGAVISHDFVARDTSLHIALDGRTATSKFSDHNAILNAVVLKTVEVGPDTDGDGLPDEWEIKYFGNLSQNGAGDADSDGLTNLQEYELFLDPSNADTDRDGLKDGDEVNVHHTDPGNADSDADGLKDGAEVNLYGSNPTLTDSDGDGLSDGDEVKIYHTNAANPDTDGDGFLDGVEVSFGRDPLVPDSPSISNIVVQAFSGGDVDEGLDLDGQFVYAINVGPDGAAGRVRDADFTSDNVSGVKVEAGAAITASGWFGAAFGDTDNDNNLEKVMGSIRHTPPVRLTFSKLTIGASYKVQLLFAEECCNRGFDVVVDGLLVADDFAPYEVQGGIRNHSQGAVVAFEFVASRDKVVILLDGSSVENPAYTDHNPILNGATLEITEDALKIGTVDLTSPNSVAISFSSTPGVTYSLQYRASLTSGNWEDVPGSVKAVGGTSTLVDAIAGHRSAGQGYWRLVKLPAAQ